MSERERRVAAWMALHTQANSILWMGQCLEETASALSPGPAQAVRDGIMMLRSALDKLGTAAHAQQRALWPDSLMEAPR